MVRDHPKPLQIREISKSRLEESPSQSVMQYNTHNHPPSPPSVYGLCKRLVCIDSTPTAASLHQSWEKYQHCGLAGTKRRSRSVRFVVFLTYTARPTALPHDNTKSALITIHWPSSAREISLFLRLVMLCLPVFCFCFCLRFFIIKQ